MGSLAAWAPKRSGKVVGEFKGSCRFFLNVSSTAFPFLDVFHGFSGPFLNMFFYGDGMVLFPFFSYSIVGCFKGQKPTTNTISVRFSSTLPYIC